MPKAYRRVKPGASGDYWKHDRTRRKPFSQRIGEWLNSPATSREVLVIVAASLALAMIF